MKRKSLIVFLAILVLAFSVVFMASCDKAEKLITLDTPVINGYDVETGKVSWKFVNNADYYEVTLSDGTNTSTTEVKTNSVQYTTKADSFDFSITAKSNGLFSDSNTASATFVKLDSDIQLDVDDNGTVSWQPVDGATGYDVSVDSTTVATVTDTSYSEIEEGRVHSIKVKPVKTGSESTIYYSSWSKSISVNKLNKINSSAITYSEGTIRWNAVASASSYKIVINNTEHEVSENKFDYSAGSESFAVTVQAIGNHTSTFDGAVSAQKSFVFLPTVSGIKVENGVLKWDAVQGATGYKVKLNGLNSSATEVNTCVLTGLSAGRQYSVTILPTAKAIDAEYFSDWSAISNIYLLPAPVLAWSGVDVDGADNVRAINWPIIDGASGYSYKVTLPDGAINEGTCGELNNFYSDNFKETGTYKIEVKATGNSIDKYDSAYSAPMNVTRLASPTVTTEKISSSAENLQKGFTVSFNPVSGASNYALFKNGNQILTSTTPQFNVTDIVESNNTRETTVAYYIQSRGANSGNNIILNSLGAAVQSTLSSAFQITVLATPTSPTITDTIYSFTGATGNGGYNVNISGQNYSAQGTTFDLDGAVNGNCTVAVCAVGNGHEVLPSTYSTSISVERLTAPYNLSISTGESDGVLNFDGDNRASSYTAIITGQKEPLTVDTTTNIREYINTTATVISMFSISNRFYDDQNTVYYMTSPASRNFTFYKLEAPANINFTNDQMIWEKPSNLDGSSAYTPTYKIYNGSNNVIYNGNFSGNSYSLATLTGGESYSFDIVAIGDGVTCINSDPSSSRQISKLSTPTLNINTTDYQYEWSSIPGASGYVLQIDDSIVSNEIHQSGNTYIYKPTYTELGEHAVTLFASGDNGATTVNSNKFEYTQKVQQLTTPEFSYSYGADYYDPAANITVNITNQTNCPNGYYYVIGTTAHFENDIAYSFNPNTSGKIDITVYAKGGGFDANEVYYLDSRQAPTVTLNLLGYPTLSTIDVNQDGQITWGKISDASGYIYKLAIVGTDGNNYIYSGTINTNTASLSLVEFKATDSTGHEITLKYNQVRNMTLELQAKGTLSSGQSSSVSGSISSQKVEKAWSSDLH